MPKRPIEERINPANVIWRYGYLKDGKLEVTDEKPTDKPITALLATSMWFWGKVSTPATVQRMVDDILRREIDGKTPEIYVAFPCRAKEGIREVDDQHFERYYGKTKAEFVAEGVKEAFVAAYMNDDLRQGPFSGKSAFDGFMTNIPSLPAKEGAEQLVSAILEGFQMIYSVGGGNTMFAKAALAEAFLRMLEEKGLIDFNAIKSHFAGFSNASIMQFYARGLIIPVHSHGSGILFFRDKQARDIIAAGEDGDIMTLQEARQTEAIVDQMMRVMMGQKEEVSRTMKAAPDMIENIQRRKEAFGEDVAINNVPFFPYLFGLTFNSVLPKFGENEKLILNIEGFVPSEKGCSPSDVLFRALECGALQPEQILFISIEDLTRPNQLFRLKKINGLIPNYEDLTPSEKKFVDENVSDGQSPQEYIDISNQEVLAEYQRIRDVARKFDIPIVDGGEQRIGHAKIPLMQPKRIDDITFDPISGELTIVSVMGEKEKRQPNLYATTKKAVDCPEPRWEEIEASCSSPGTYMASDYPYGKNTGNQASHHATGHDLVNATKLSPLNEAAFSMELGESEDVVVGNMLNVTDMHPDNITYKGLFIHCPRDGGAPGAGYQICDSNQLDNARFLIFSIALPTDLDPSYKDEYVENRNDLFRKFFSDMGVDIPVFITTAENRLNLSECPRLFEARVNLREMVEYPELVPAVVSMESFEESKEGEKKIM